MIHNLTASSILNQLILRTPCCLGDNLFSYNTKKGKNTKKQNAKHQELADSKHCKEPRDLKMYQSTRVDAYIKIQDPSLLYICTYSNNAITRVVEPVLGIQTDKMKRAGYTYIHTFLPLSLHINTHKPTNQQTEGSLALEAKNYT